MFRIHGHVTRCVKRGKRSSSAAASRRPVVVGQRRDEGRENARTPGLGGVNYAGWLEPLCLSTIHHVKLPRLLSVVLDLPSARR